METLDAVERERDNLKTNHQTTWERFDKVLQENVAKLSDLQSGEVPHLLASSAYTCVN